MPGVGYQPDPDAIGEIVIGSWLPNVGGTRQGWSTVTIDGIPGNDIGLPEVSSHSMNPDAVGEVNVQLTNFTADTGRNGGAQINLVTKAGTNDFSGTAYTYGRSEQFRSEDYFDKQAGIPKPEYRYWTLGANAGGPIVQDKVFFFYSYEQWGVRTPQNLAQLTVPSLAERMGDFSRSFDQSGNLIPVIDPLTGMPFQGNVVPADRINPHGQALLNWYPDPNVDGQSNYNYQFQGQQRAPRINNVTRVDVRPTANDAIYAPLLALAAADQLLARGLGDAGTDVHLQRFRGRHQLHARHRRQHGERVQLRLAPLVRAQPVGQLLRHQPEPAHRLPHRFPRRRRP